MMLKLCPTVTRPLSLESTRPGLQRFEFTERRIDTQQERVPCVSIIELHFVSDVSDVVDDDDA